MIAKLNDNQQRQLAIGILALVVAAVLMLTIGPIWAANASRQATLDQAYERLQRYEQIAARDKALLPQYESIRHAQKSSGNHLRSDTVAVAGAELQRRVKTITSQNNAQIVSTQILPAADEQGFIRVALKVRLRGQLPAILQSFYDIETNDVYMFVDKVALRDNLVGRSQFKVQLRPIDAEFDLIAYMPETS
ncbi:MAG: type II secretion system protein GspM [Gammaproteobacteria bacterium]|nr:type II secretion system protein GspM [Gammaproteobacteria bacterium]MDH3805747.1 type II secretion system protein GspM [Gammaproteobacteria bacterium]